MATPDSLVAGTNRQLPPIVDPTQPEAPILDPTQPEVPIFWLATAIRV